MISPRMTVREIDPRGWSAYVGYLQKISQRAPQAVLWHEDGIPRRFVLDGEARQFGLSRITDARISARLIYDNNSYRVRRVIITDRDSYDNLCAAQNLTPAPDEGRYAFLARVIEAVKACQNEKFGIYPELSLDRGPVGFQAMSDFLRQNMSVAGTFLLSVFAEENLSFSLIASVEQGEVTLVTSLDRYAGSWAAVDFSAESLDRAAEMISGELGPLAGGLFIQERDFTRLFDGAGHAEFPSALILGGLAFGYSQLPGVVENTLLHTAGLFAYAPDWAY
ncbi:hypothetical protein LLH00_08635 [bacterium]|nr:hypothetical protein [bacterium]